MDIDLYTYFQVIIFLVSLLTLLKSVSAGNLIGNMADMIMQASAKIMAKFFHQLGAGAANLL